MPPRTDRTPAYRPKLVAQTDLVRLTGYARSTVSEACAGPLAPAYRGGRLDLAHPAAREWLAARGFDPDQLAPVARKPRAPVIASARRPHATATAKELSRRTGVSVGEIREQFAGALIPATHVTASQVAFFAGCDDEVVFDAIDAGELAGAVQCTGFVDLAHPSVLAFMAARPFERTASEDIEAPPGFLTPATVGDEIDVDHPVARIFLARCLGRVPQPQDLVRS